MHEPEVFTSDEKPGVVLLRQGRYSIQLDELQRKALEQMNRAERRRFAAELRTVKRFRNRPTSAAPAVLQAAQEAVEEATTELIGAP